MPQACTGYAAYDILADLTISVQGEIPTWAPGSAQEAKIAEMWQRFGPLVSASCRAHGVPATWFMGIMAIESAGDPNACSPCDPATCSFYPACQPCCAYGLMQMIHQTARCYGASSAQDLIGRPDLAIELAARMLSELIYGDVSGYRCAAGPYGMDLPRIASSYNAGSARCSGAGTFGLAGQHDYAMAAVRSANTAARLGIPAWPRPFSLGAVAAAGMLALAGGLVAYIIASGRVPRASRTA